MVYIPWVYINYTLSRVTYGLIVSYIVATCSYFFSIYQYPLNPEYPDQIEQQMLVSQQTKSDTYLVQTYKNFLDTDFYILTLVTNQKNIREGDIVLLLGKPLWRTQKNDTDTGDVNREKISYTHHIDGRFFAKNTLVVGHVSSWMTTIRQIIRDRLSILYPSQDIYSIVGGMLIGDTASLSVEFKDFFRTSGLSHILVVSGGNIMLVTIFLSYCLFWIPISIRSVLIGLCIVMYALLCGLDASVFRAAVMALLGLIALIPGRSVSIWRILGITRCGMLILNPFYVIYDVGFLLSFAAVVGLVLCQSYLPRYTYTGCNHIAGYIYPSVAATIGVSPIVFYFFQGLNVLGVFANIFVGICVPIITVGSGVSLVFYDTWFGHILAYIVTICSQWIIMIAHGATTYGIYIELVSPAWKLGFFIFMISIAIRAIWCHNTVQSSERSSQ